MTTRWSLVYRVDSRAYLAPQLILKLDAKRAAEQKAEENKVVSEYVRETRREEEKARKIRTGEVSDYPDFLCPYFLATSDIQLS